MSQAVGIIIILALSAVFAEPVSENLKYRCLESSVKLDFKRKSPAHEVSLSTDLFRVKECNKKFTTDEPTVMEIDFEKCTLGRRNFFINVDEYKPGEVDSLFYSLPVYCENKPISPF